MNSEACAGSVQGAVKDDLQIDFVEIALSYAQPGFTEAKTNDGSMKKPVTITLTGDTLTGADGRKGQQRTASMPCGAAGGGSVAIPHTKA